jgi:hypothetical protein
MNHLPISFEKYNICFSRLLIPILVILFAVTDSIYGQSLDIPVKGYGISFGNSKKFVGLRFNFADRYVDRIDGVNFTLWRSDYNKDAVVRGLSFGVLPNGGDLSFIQVGIAGVAAEYSISGFSVGILGVGAGEDVSGINIGGLGAGAGGSIKGINIGGLGVGAGGDLIGLNIGGLGAGAGRNARGINLGLLGVGAGEDLWGINFGGLGAGAGENVYGLSIGGLGVGAGNNMTGINIGGLGVGAGNELRGLSVAILGAGSPSVKGIILAGGAVGGEEITGISIAIAHVRIEDDGILTGFAASAFNYVKGLVRGVTVGIFNYAYEVNGLQLGVLNYVADNPSGLKILPIFNTNF